MATRSSETLKSGEIIERISLEIIPPGTDSCTDSGDRKRNHKYYRIEHEILLRTFSEFNEILANFYYLNNSMSFDR
jgi:hypothetical protein